MHKLVALVLFLSAQALEAGNNPIPLWWPLQKDNVWVLQATNEEIQTISCSQTFGSRTLVGGLSPVDTLFRYGSPGFLYGQEDSPRWQPVFRFNRRNGRNYLFNLTGKNCDTVQATWTSNDVAIVAPAGTFTGCRHLLLTLWPGVGPDCGAVDPSELWFAPNVGPVALKSATGDLFLLTSAKVGLKTYPAPTNGLVAALIADYDSYVNGAAGIFCPPCTTNTPPCEVPCRIVDPFTSTAQFTFTVVNESTNPVTLTFPTGQRFDIDLIDGSGNVVKAWSDGRAFPDFVMPVTMQPGQTNTYAGDILLTDRQGNQLNGQYLARGFLTDTSEPKVQATTSISVKVVQP